MTDEIKAQIISPEILNGKAVFRLKAPNAKSVKLTGITDSTIALAQNDQGIWEVEVGPLQPELYSYCFEVDGTKITDPSNRNVKKWLSCESQFEISGGLIHEEQDVPHGTVHHHNIGGEKFCVYSPPGETTNADLPSLYLLHGYGDDHTAWIDVGRAHFIVDNLIAKKAITPLFIVMPYGHPEPYNIQEDFDSYANRNLVEMESTLLGTLMHFVESEYDVASASKSRAIAGLSMGGGQSIGIGLNRSECFSKIGGFSSAVPTGNPEQLESAFSRYLTSEACPDLLWVACGQEDFLHERNLNFVSWLTARGIRHEWCETDGGHEWTVWRKYLESFLRRAFGV